MERPAGPRDDDGGTTEVPRSEWERYLWLKSQVISNATAAPGAVLFELALLLPPAASLEESIDLARQPFIEGSAFIPVLKHSARRAKHSYACVRCEPVAIDGYEQFRMGVHGEPDHRFHWAVTDFLTGLAVANGSSRADAVKKTRGYLSKGNAKQYLEQVKRARESLAAEGKRLGTIEAIRRDTKGQRKRAGGAKVAKPR